jgi:hypothetical protein
MNTALGDAVFFEEELICHLASPDALLVVLTDEEEQTTLVSLFSDTAEVALRAARALTYVDGNPAAVREAGVICGGCPVRVECADTVAGLHRAGEPVIGVWAGRYLPRSGTVAVGAAHQREGGPRGTCPVHRWAAGRGDVGTRARVLAPQLDAEAGGGVTAATPDRVATPPDLVRRAHRHQRGVAGYRARCRRRHRRVPHAQQAAGQRVMLTLARVPRRPVKDPVQPIDVRRPSGRPLPF